MKPSAHSAMFVIAYHGIQSDCLRVTGLLAPSTLTNQIEPHLNILKPTSFIQAVMEICHSMRLLLLPAFHLPHHPLSAVSSVCLTGLVQTLEGPSPLSIHQMQVFLSGRAGDMGFGTHRV